MVEKQDAVQREDGEVVIRGDNLDELEAYVRYSMGRGLYLIPTKVHVGNTTPRDITDETEDGEPTMLFENTRIMEAGLEIEEGGTLALRLPPRGELHKRFMEKYEGGHELSPKEDNDER